MLMAALMVVQICGCSSEEATVATIVDHGGLVVEYSIANLSELEPDTIKKDLGSLWRLINLSDAENLTVTISHPGNPSSVFVATDEDGAYEESHSGFPADSLRIEIAADGVDLTGDSDADLASIRARMEKCRSRIEWLSEFSGRIEFLVLASANAEKHLPNIAFNEDGSPCDIPEAADLRWVEISRADQRGFDLVPGPFEIVRFMDDKTRFDVMEFDLRDVESRGHNLAKLVGDRGLEILVINDVDLTLTGRHVFSTRSGRDELGRQSLSIAFDEKGAALLELITTIYQPRNESKRLLGIAFNNELLTAAVITGVASERIEISGDFIEDEIDEMILRLRTRTILEFVRPARTTEYLLPEEKSDSADN